MLKEDLHKSFQAYQNALYYLENIMDPQLWYGIGILYEKFESYEHAISSLMAVLKMSPNFYQKSEVLSRLGYIFARTNDLSNAIVYFQNSILTNTFTVKRKVDIMIKIGILHEEKNELVQAQKSYEAALTQDSDNYTAYQHLSWISYLQGNHPQAMDYANKAEEKSPDTLDTQYIKARINQQIGLHDEAERLYSEIVQKNPNSALYWCSWAVLNYEQNQCEQAFEKIISATKLNGQMVESWYNFGILYEKCKQSDEAIVAYKKALEIDPDDQDARTRLLSIQSPMYNPDNTNMLYMKFPQFRIPNNLVIDKKYKKPQNQRTIQSQMQGVGGVMGEIGGEQQNQFVAPQPSYNQAPSLNQVASTNYSSVQQPSSQFTVPHNSQNQFEEEKRVYGGVPQNQQFNEPATTKYAAQNFQNYQQNTNQPRSNNSSYNPGYNASSQNFDNQNQSYDPNNQSRQNQPMQNYGGPQNQSDPQRLYQQQNQYGYSSQNIPTTQPQYQQQNKMAKVDEYGQGHPVNQQYYQQPPQNDSQNMSIRSFQGGNKDVPEQPTSLNQLSQNLNTQTHMPNLQSSVGIPQNTQNYPQNSQYSQQQPNIQSQSYPQNTQSQPNPYSSHQPPSQYQSQPATQGPNQYDRQSQPLQQNQAYGQGPTQMPRVSEAQQNVQNNVQNQNQMPYNQQMQQPSPTQNYQNTQQMSGPPSNTQPQLYHQDSYNRGQSEELRRQNSAQGVSIAPQPAQNTMTMGAQHHTDNQNVKNLPQMSTGNMPQLNSGNQIKPEELKTGENVPMNAAPAQPREVQQNMQGSNTQVPQNQQENQYVTSGSVREEVKSENNANTNNTQNQVDRNLENKSKFYCKTLPDYCV